MGLTVDIAEFVSRLRLDTPPAQAWPIVRTGFRDCFGVMIAGWNEAAPVLLRRGILENSDLHWADTLRLASAPDGGLLLGMAAHVLDFDDTAMGAHPSAVLVPAILAESWLTGADARKMALAYLAGYEVWAELNWRETEPLHSKGWHPSAVLGVVAATAAASVIRRLEAETIARALSIACSMTGGVVANFGSMTKSYQLGRAVRAGLTAVRLAEAGLTAASDAIEHPLGLLHAISPRGRPDVTSPTALGERWRILESGINIKLYPICYAAHRIVDATKRLKASHNFSVTDIFEVDVEIGELQAAILCEHAPSTGLQGKFSAAFAVASILVAGRCTLAELSDEFVTREDVQAVISRVRIRTVEGKSPFEATFSAADRVRVKLADGRVLDSGLVELPSGHFHNGGSTEDHKQKFIAGVAPVFGEAEAERQFTAFEASEYLPELHTLAPPVCLRGAA